MCVCVWQDGGWIKVCVSVSSNERAEREKKGSCGVHQYKPQNLKPGRKRGERVRRRETGPEVCRLKARGKCVCVCVCVHMDGGATERDFKAVE